MRSTAELSLLRHRTNRGRSPPRRSSSRPPRGTGSSSSSPCSWTCTASRAPRWFPSPPSTGSWPTAPVRRIRRRADGPVPSSPDILAMPDLSSYMPAPWRPGLGIIQCDPHVLGEPWPFAPRVILRRQIERLAESGFALKVGAEAEYFLVRRSASGGIEVADPLDQAKAPVLRRPGPYPDVRPPDHGLAPHEHPRVGQLRQRPRGRQRPVRAELQVRRPDDHGGPGHRVPLHDPFAGRRGRHAGHVHAQAVLQSDRERAAHAPEHVGRRRRGALRRPERRRGLGHVDARATPSSPACSSTPRRWRRWPARRSTPTSGWPAPPRIRERPGRRSSPPTAGNDRTHMLRVPDAGPGRGPVHRRFGQSLPDHQRAIVAGGLDGIDAQARTRAIPASSTCSS